VYVYAGEAQLGEQARPTAARTLAVLSQTEGSHGVIVRAAQAARLLVLAGRPLHQPIAQWGPFVMNTRAEIEQAIADMRAGTLA
jgi:redox-sensitive bicupin YhaK (pirin superfamily)